MTNHTGCAKFEGIPVDNYTLTIQETSEYQGYTKLVNLNELQYQQFPTLEINLSKSQYGHTKFVVFNEEEGRIKEVRIEIVADNGESIKLIN